VGDDVSEPERSKGYPDSVSLDDEDGVARVLTQSVLGLWDVVSNLARLRPTHWRRFRVTVFGSARAEPGTLAYEQVKALARALAAMGCEVVTGGGPGLMQAANEGAMAAPGGQDRSVGIRIQLDFEQQTNPFVGEAYEHRTFFSRLHHFVLLSHAFVVVPGGIGTTLEALMIWQLLQVRKVYGTPLILIGRMWPPFVQWARDHMLGAEPLLADPVDLDIPRCVGDVGEAVEIIREYHAQWVRDRMSMKGSPGGAAGSAPGG
jgi:uncharacterized protein (TIGR00730 family)